MAAIVLARHGFSSLQLEKVEAEQRDAKTTAWADLPKSQANGNKIRVSRERHLIETKQQHNSVIKIIFFKMAA